jgi:RNA polymerase sigma factor (sigma-70 family)
MLPRPRLPPRRSDAALDAYVESTKRYPRLRRSEEQRLGRSARRGDQSAFEQLVNAHLRTVVRIAREYRRLHPNLLELIQEGNVALLRAVRRFDPDRAGRLRAYAASWIRTYLDRFIEEQVTDAPAPDASAPRFAEGPHEAVEERQILARLGAALSEIAKQLSGRDLSIFRHRLLGMHPCTLADEGARLGITAERVRQIEAAITAQVRLLVLGSRELQLAE